MLMSTFLTTGAERNTESRFSWCIVVDVSKNNA